MSKKIIALSLAILLIVTCFVACGKKYDTTKVNGEDVILITDENGNPVIHEADNVIALVTDSNGEVLTYENGENQTRYIQIKDALEVDNFVYGDHNKMKLLSGWTVDGRSRLVKDKTEENCHISFTLTKTLKGEETLADYLDAVDEQNDLLVDVLAKQGSTLTMSDGTASISGGKIVAEKRVYKIVDAEGNVTHYAEKYYFVAGKSVYSLNYACENGVGYDESFNFEEFARTSFTYID